MTVEKVLEEEVEGETVSEPDDGQLRGQEEPAREEEGLLIDKELLD